MKKWFTSDVANHCHLCSSSKKCHPELLRYPSTDRWAPSTSPKRIPDLPTHEPRPLQPGWRFRTISKESLQLTQFAACQTRCVLTRLNPTRANGYLTIPQEPCGTSAPKKQTMLSSLLLNWWQTMYFNHALSTTRRDFQHSFWHGDLTSMQDTWEQRGKT